MLKQMTNIIRDFKCGDVFCATPTQYNVSCSLCKEKVLFELFPAHFRSKHLGLNVDDHPHEIVDSNEPDDDPFAQIVTVKCELKEEDEMPIPTNFIDETEDYDHDYDVGGNDDHFNDFDSDKQSIKSGSEDDDLPLAQRKLKMVGTVKPKKDTTTPKKNNKRATRKTRSKDAAAKSKASTETATDDANADICKQEPNTDENQKPQSNDDNDNSADFDNLDLNDGNTVDDDDDEEWKLAPEPNMKRVRKPGKKGPEMRYICQKCFVQSQGRDAFKAHMKIHTNFEKSVANSKVPEEEIFKCQEEGCDLIFPTAEMLSGHAYRHKGFSCDICGRTFKHMITLINHGVRHTDKRDFACKYCEHRSYTIAELKEHMNKHTGDRAVICDICGKKCRDRGALNHHKRRHTGERPYKCEVCEKRFFTGPGLKEHLSSHTAPDDRPFECFCGARTKTKKALNTHQKVHETVKPYKCELCSKAFAKERGLKSHMYSHDMNIMKAMRENTTRKRKEPVNPPPPVFEQDPFLLMVQNLDHHLRPN